MATNGKRSWFQRNWQWFLPVSVLSSILLLVVFLGLVQALNFVLIKKSDLYRDTARLIRYSDEVVEAFGPSFEVGVRVSQKIEPLDSGSRTELSFPVSGDGKTGTVRVVAIDSGGRTVLQTFEVRVDGGETVLDLLKSGFFNRR